MAAAPTEIAIHKRKGDGDAKRMGFFTDTTTCIGCKACEVACKQWNDLPADNTAFRKGGSYDHTGELNASTWRHVRSEEHTSELQSRQYLVCRLLLEKKKIHLYTP